MLKIDGQNDGFGPPKASQNDPKIGPKSDQKSMQKTKRKKNRHKTKITPSEVQKPLKNLLYCMEKKSHLKKSRALCSAQGCAQSCAQSLRTKPRTKQNVHAHKGNWSLRTSPAHKPVHKAKRTKPHTRPRAIRMRTSMFSMQYNRRT